MVITRPKRVRRAAVQPCTPALPTTAKDPLDAVHLLRQQARNWRRCTNRRRGTVGGGRDIRGEKGARATGAAETAGGGGGSARGRDTRRSRISSACHPLIC
ncbi:unnamed protein product [Prorocentrum cordatum]|uniref:Uncharacterized protein n=1 Tax=Prorocentrum cordatum TaxID=2364126 RepID=A0ABN9WJT1_9DINO|nr:unnamed protein product [Polarella glacialis]